MGEVERGGGAIDVAIDPRGFVVCTLRGHLTFAMSARAQAEIERLAIAHPRVDSILYDGTDLAGFDSGLPIRWIKWALKRRSRRVALVGSLPAALAVVATFPFLLPRMRYRVFRDRSAGGAFVSVAKPYAARA